MISVIIPIYHGQQYIGKQIQQIEKAALRLCDSGKEHGADIELLFVNDAPDDPFAEDFYSDIVIVRAMNTDRNRGIHGARVWGISQAKGEYVHFLDQDDEISPEFYKSQLTAIGDADAVYCRGYSDRREIYDTDRVFETSVLRENILDRAPMISPGQALIRKRAIPGFWKENILSHSGSDDFMLWLCMTAENRSFAINQEKLYKHVRTGINLSSDIYRSGLSDREMVEKILGAGLFEGEEANLVKQLPDKQFRRKNDIQLKAQASYYYLRVLLEGERRGYGLSDYLNEKNYKRLAIYGAGDLGLSLDDIIQSKVSSEVEVLFFLDKNAGFMDLEKPVYTLESAIQQHKVEVVDAILVAMALNADKIKTWLESRVSVPCLTIQNVVTDLEEDASSDFKEIDRWNYK